MLLRAQPCLVAPARQGDNPPVSSQPPPHEPWTPPDHAWQPPARGGGSSRLPILLIALLVGLLVVAIGAFLVMLASGVGNALVGRTPIAEVAVGQCFNGMTAAGGGAESTGSQLALILGVLVVDCAEPHDAELIGRFDRTGDGAYPGEAELARYSEEGCRERFANYVGTDFELSTLELTYTYPVEAQWSAGVRSFECMVVAADHEQRLVGSVRGTRR